MHARIKSLGTHKHVSTVETNISALGSSPFIVVVVQMIIQDKPNQIPHL